VLGSNSVSFRGGRALELEHRFDGGSNAMAKTTALIYHA
jgi:hypothetical protein